MTENSKKVFWNLVILFEIIFAVKVLISLLVTGPVIIPDEICVLKRASFLAEHFRLTTCENATGMPGAGNPLPLYSFLLAPIYWFTYGLTAFRVALLLNIFLLASLVFPLYSIFKRFLENDKIIFGSVAALLFLPQILVFEDTVMTETIFIVINVWFLYFYSKSFDVPAENSAGAKRHWINKAAALALAILGIFARPFGFILPLSFAINEALRSNVKHKKKFVLAVFAATIVLGGTSIFLFNSNIFASLFGYLKGLNDWENWKNIGLALVEQVNSFSIATFIFPIFIFFSNILRKDDKEVNNIKYFLLAYIGLNFLISAQHIYGYLVKDGNPGVITRYIQSSLVYLYIYFIIFFVKFKTLTINWRMMLVIMTLLGSVLFLPMDGFKHSLNTDLGLFGNTEQHLFGTDTIQANDLLKIYFMPISFGIFILFFLKKRVLLIGILCVAIFSNSFFIATKMIPQGGIGSIVKFFADKKENIAFISAPILSKQGNINYIDGLYHISGLSRNEMNVIFVKLPKNKANVVFTKDMFKDSTSFKEAKYILTPSVYPFKDLPLIVSNKSINIYSTQNIK